MSVSAITRNSAMRGVAMALAVIAGGFVAASPSVASAAGGTISVKSGHGFKTVKIKPSGFKKVKRHGRLVGFKKKHRGGKKVFKFTRHGLKTFVK